MFEIHSSQQQQQQEEEEQQQQRRREQGRESEESEEREGEGRGWVMRQMVPMPPITWSNYGSIGPISLIGQREWQVRHS